MVGLVVLLMLTLLGVSSMNMTSLELRIAGNTQNRNLAFQGADSLNDLIFYTDTAGAYRFDFTTANPQAFGPEVASGVSTTATGTYQGRGNAILCPGNSLSISCNAFQLSSTATHAASNASATVVQGFVRPGVALD